VLRHCHLLQHVRVHMLLMKLLSRTTCEVLPRLPLSITMPIHSLLWLGVTAEARSDSSALPILHVALTARVTAFAIAWMPWHPLWNSLHHDHAPTGSIVWIHRNCHASLHLSRHTALLHWDLLHLASWSWLHHDINLLTRMAHARLAWLALHLLHAMRDHHATGHHTPWHGLHRYVATRVHPRLHHLRLWLLGSTLLVARGISHWVWGLGHHVSASFGALMTHGNATSHWIWHRREALRLLLLLTGNWGLRRCTESHAVWPLWLPSWARHATLWHVLRWNSTAVLHGLHGRRLLATIPVSLVWLCHKAIAVTPTTGHSVARRALRLGPW
jgi:hypothetical protein